MSNKVNLLIVEDSDNDFFFMQHALAGVKNIKTFHRVINGKEALEYLKNPDNLRPCVVIMDINMPVMDGYACLKELKEDMLLRTVPVLMLSTLDQVSDALNSYSRCAFSHIVKPKTVQEYKEIFESIDTYWFETNLYPR